VSGCLCSCCRRASDLLGSPRHTHPTNSGSREGTVFRSHRNFLHRGRGRNRIGRTPIVRQGNGGCTRRLRRIRRYGTRARSLRSAWDPSLGQRRDHRRSAGFRSRTTRSLRLRNARSTHRCCHSHHSDWGSRAGPHSCRRSSGFLQDRSGDLLSSRLPHRSDKDTGARSRAGDPGGLVLWEAGSCWEGA